MEKVSEKADAEARLGWTVLPRTGSFDLFHDNTEAHNITQKDIQHEFLIFE